ncbi:MAG: hypothetical protein Q4F29_01200 [Lachnospiraceae bacterium]|nr:hypothetical protein [Lachnospiraceae bacterium]
MKKRRLKNKWLLGSVTGMLVLSAAGCGIAETGVQNLRNGIKRAAESYAKLDIGQMDRNLRIMRKQVVVEDYEISEEDGNLCAVVTVQLPDYSRYLEACAREAAEDSKNVKQMERRLLRMVVKEGKKEPEFCQREVVLNLTELDEKKTEEQWKESEIIAEARKAAVEAEKAEYSLSLLAELYPVPEMDGEEAQQ